MNKILFLDIDGVLNHEKSIKEYGSTAHIGTIKELINLKGELSKNDVMFDCNSMILLKKILDEYSPNLVIISSWNSWLGESDYIKIFETYNIDIRDNLIGLTENTLDKCRGTEIYQWRLSNDILSDYIIIDDYYDFLVEQSEKVLKIGTDGFSDNAYSAVENFLINKSST